MNTSDARMILSALKEFCAETNKNADGYITKETFQNCYDQMIAAMEILHAKFPHRFNEFRLADYSHYKSRAKYYMDTVLLKLKADINFYLTATNNEVQEPSKQQAPTPRMNITKRGLFSTGDYFDVYVGMKDIIQTAQRNIVVIDGHVSDGLISLFEMFEGTVPVTVVTKSPQMRPALKAQVKKFNERYRKSLKVIADNCYLDRYVIIDEKEVYHLGSVGNSERNGFMFSRITEPILITALLGDLNNKGYLQKSTVINRGEMDANALTMMTIQS